jgi:hypothetical protein
MESGEIFEAEVTLEGDEADQRGSDNINGNNTGIRAMIAGNGGYDKHLASVTTEASPLLPDGSGSGSESGEDDEDAATNMPGATDFEGMPWWKTPSVGLLVNTGTQHALTLPYRYSGCCLPISSSPLLSVE